MKRPSRKVLAFITAALLNVGVLGLGAGQVAAGSGLTQWSWAASGYYPSTTSYKYSNISGMWQVVLAGFGCMKHVDGIFGSATQSVTNIVQGTMGVPQTGAADSTSWSTAQSFPGEGGGLALHPNGVTGYSYTQYVYSPGGSAGLFQYSSYLQQWQFDANVDGQGTNPAWFLATPSRTMGSSNGQPSCPVG